MRENSERPVVSVVMIAYNMEKYIAEAIKGVVMQKTYFPFELIVMDDCSTDSTPDIIAEWQKRYPSIIKNVRNPQNLGLQANYLKGFSLCKGKYMAICDADDYWFHRKKLSKQVSYMECNPGCAITFHRMINFYETTGEKSLSNGGQAVDTGLEELSRSNYITNSSVMYRREAIDLTKLPEWIQLDKSPDYAMHILYARTGRIHFFKRPMGVYRKSAGSAWSMTKQFEKLRMSLSVRMLLMDEIKSHEEALKGLRFASANILKAMAAAAITLEEKEYVRTQAEKLRLKLETTQSSGSHKSRKPLTSRIRGAISKLVPLPKP